MNRRTYSLYYRIYDV
uniref:Uncharacterized protein n=1 Tax=Arundo donax TaxID=35708 RepID=A0A0A8Z442_ARUDO